MTASAVLLQTDVLSHEHHFGLLEQPKQKEPLLEVLH